MQLGGSKLMPTLPSPRYACKTTARVQHVGTATVRRSSTAFADTAERPHIQITPRGILAARALSMALGTTLRSPLHGYCSFTHTWSQPNRKQPKRTNSTQHRHTHAPAAFAFILPFFLGSHRRPLQFEVE